MFDGLRLARMELPEATLRVRHGGSGPPSTPLPPFTVWSKNYRAGLGIDGQHAIATRLSLVTAASPQAAGRA
jgi:hypothetical protein